MLDWLIFHMGEIIGLIHATEKKDIIEIKQSCVITLVQYLSKEEAKKRHLSGLVK